MQNNNSDRQSNYDVLKQVLECYMGDAIDQARQAIAKNKTQPGYLKDFVNNHERLVKGSGPYAQLELADKQARTANSMKWMTIAMLVMTLVMLVCVGIQTWFVVRCSVNSDSLSSATTAQRSVTFDTPAEAGAVPTTDTR